MENAIVALDHVQLAMPAAGEDAAREFFCRILGFEEIRKPEALRKSGGVWFRSGAVELHLGVEEPFLPARKAHPCLVVANIDQLAEALQARSYHVSWDDRIPCRRRFFSSDPFGNRLEFVQA